MDPSTSPRLRELAIGLILVAAANVLTVPSPVSAHDHFGENTYQDCRIAASQAHGTSSGVDADTYEFGVSTCEAVQAKARWKVDGQWYSDEDTDSWGTLYASAGTAGGFDLFSSSDHNALEANTWWGWRIWH